METVVWSVTLLLVGLILSITVGTKWFWKLLGELGFYDEDAENPLGKYIAFSGVRIFILFAVLSVVFFLSHSWCSIPVRHSGLVRGLGGKIMPFSLEPGLHFIYPWWQVTPMFTARNVIKQEAEGSSLDQQTVKTTLYIGYNIEPDKVHELAKKVTGEVVDSIMLPSILDAVKAQIARIKVENLLLNRGVIHENVDSTLDTRFEPYFIKVHNVAIGDISFDPNYEKAIEEKQSREQDAMRAGLEAKKQEKTAEKQKIVAEGLANQATATASGKWDAYTIEQTATAESAQMIAEAEGKRYEMISQVISKNPILIQYRAIYNWDGELSNYQLGESIISKILERSVEIKTNQQSQTGKE